MALSITVKNAIAGMSNSDKALALAYILGKDDAAVVADVADAFVRTYYPQYPVENLTNEQRALGMLRQVYAYIRGVYRDNLVQDAETVRQIAIAQADADTAPDNPLEEMPG